MEQEVNTNKPTDNVANISKVVENTPEKVKTIVASFSYNIRRINKVSIPNGSPAERVLRIGSAIDPASKSTLKGISGELEDKFMPIILGINSNSPEYRRTINDYWASLSVVVPHDEGHLKDEEQGIVLKIVFSIKGEGNKRLLDNNTKVVEKVKMLNTMIEKGLVVLDDDYIANYLLLNYVLKYRRVANYPEDVNKSTKIDFYIFDKPAALKDNLSKIDLYSKGIEVFSAIKTDEKKVDSVLLQFKQTPTNFDSLNDKVVKLFELYKLNDNNLALFIKYAEDLNWETKYLINLAVTKNKINNPINSTVYYYNSHILGRTLDEAVEQLNNGTPEMLSIKTQLQKEVTLD